MKNLKIFILTLGVFSIINTEMGVVGILPMIAQHYDVTITTAGLLVSLFALAVAVSGPTLPLLFSGMNRKYAMMLVLTTFTVCNIISAFSPNFSIALIARVLPAFLHPVYVSMAFSVASTSVDEKDAPKAVSKVMMGVSAGMVLGVPVISYIVNATTLTVGMLFFAVVSVIALIATIIFIPSSPVKNKLSYKQQLGILKETKTWLTIIGVVLLNGSVFGVYSYLSDYLTQISGFEVTTVSIVLFAYGLANITGNVIAGKMLSHSPLRFIVMIPVSLLFVYIIQLLLGSFMLSTAILIFIWGVLAGCIGNINQYWMTSSAPQAPDFANGLFLAATNLGTTLITSLCGFIITISNVSYIFIGGLLALAGAIAFILIRMQIERNKFSCHAHDANCSSWLL